MHDRAAAIGLTALLLCLPLWSAGCESKRKGPAISKTPASIRGWLIDPGVGSQRIMHLTDTASGEAAHRARVFEQTNLSIEGFPYASGGMAANGSFIILDVPPGDVTVNFQPPDGLDAQLFLESVPPNADIFLPALQIKGSEVIPTDPGRIVVRVPGRVESPRPLPGNTTVSGHAVKLMEVPLSAMIDRREFPEPK